MLDIYIDVDWAVCLEQNKTTWYFDGNQLCNLQRTEFKDTVDWDGDLD